MLKGMAAIWTWLTLVLLPVAGLALFVAGAIAWLTRNRPFD